MYPGALKGILESSPFAESQVLFFLFERDGMEITSTCTLTNSCSIGHDCLALNLWESLFKADSNQGSKNCALVVEAMGFYVRQDSEQKVLNLE